MRRTTVTLLVVGGVLLLGGASAQLAAIRTTQPDPTRGCEPSAPLRIVFGDASLDEGGALRVPLYVENVGARVERVLVTHWEADVYRARWDGRLSTLGTQALSIDHIAGYTGEDVEPGARTSIGDVQLSESEGRFHIVAFAGEACGATTLRA